MPLGRLKEPKELNFSETHRLFAYASVNFLRDSIHTTKKNKKILLVDSKWIDLEVNSAKTKYPI
jgi:hypothetical protein